jgi:hypothetical protein
MTTPIPQLAPHAGPPSLSRFRPGTERDREDFASVLGIADRLIRDGEQAVEDRARETAETFVAKALVEPILTQVRESNTQPPPFGPGRGEKQFAALIDAKRAMDLVRSTEWPIVERLTSDLARAARGEA